MKNISTAKHAGRPIDFLGFDGHTYNGRVERVIRRRWLVFVYHVSGLGEVRCTLDLRSHRDRVLEIY